MIIRESKGTFDFRFKMKKNLDVFLFYVFVIKSKNEFQISISIFIKVRKMDFCLFFYEIFSVLIEFRILSFKFDFQISIPFSKKH